MPKNLPARHRRTRRFAPDGQPGDGDLDRDHQWRDLRAPSGCSANVTNAPAVTPGADRGNPAGIASPAPAPGRKLGTIRARRFSSVFLTAGSSPTGRSGAALIGSNGRSLSAASAPYQGTVESTLRLRVRMDAGGTSPTTADRGQPRRDRRGSGGRLPTAQATTTIRAAAI
jgi:hypothetical protein